MRSWARRLIDRRNGTVELEKVQAELASTKRQLKVMRQRLKNVARDYLLLKMPQDSVCAEIGVDEGDFSEQIFWSTDPERLHLIDPWQHFEEYQNSCYGGLGPDGQTAMDRKYQRVRDRLAAQIDEDRVVVHRLPSNKAASLFENGCLDWLYLDANHLYEFVKWDLELFYPKVRPGGYMCGDDYGVRGWWQGGVTRAVNEFVKENDLELEVKASQFIIRKNTSGASRRPRVSKTSSHSQRTRAKSRIPHSGGSSEIGSLPDFLIIGAQKCGTTSLYDGVMRRHEYFKAAIKKEIHFFDTPKYKKGVRWYRKNFPPRHRKNGREVITGEASPFYLFHPHAARRAAQTVPEARLIVLLRDPVERAYSDYRHRLRAGLEHLSFEAAIETEGERLAGEKEKMLADENYLSRNYRRYSYLARGIYVDQIMDWREHFVEDQFLILRSEDFFVEPDRTVEAVQAFLELPRQEIRLERVLGKGHHEPMNPETRQRLQEYFEPHNQRLYEYLSKDFGW